MSFHGLEGCLADSAFSTDEGRKRIAMMLKRLDASWDEISRTTLSVMCVVYACAPEDSKELARKMLTGLFGLLRRVHSAWEDSCGGSIREAYEPVDALADAKEVDKDGVSLGKEVGEFGMVVMSRMLSPIPPGWTMHFKSIHGLSAELSRQLSDSDWKYLVSIILEEQRRLIEEYGKSMEDAMEDGSEVDLRVAKWVALARPTYESHKAEGLGCEDAMKTAIMAFGFPKVEVRT